LNLSDATNRGSNLGAAELAKVLSDLEVVKNPVRVYVPLCKFNLYPITISGHFGHGKERIFPGR
jgi:hypothetical protein